MKHLIRLFTACSFLFSLGDLSGQSLSPQDSIERAAIQQVIQASYIDAIYNLGDTTAMRQGFHEGFQLLGLRADQSLRILPIAEWVALVQEKKNQGKYPPSAQSRVSVNFLRIDVVETVASAKIEFLVGGQVRYIDFLALYKFGNDWKIMNKVYYELPK